MKKLILVLVAFSLPALADEVKGVPMKAIASAVQQDIGKFVDCYDTNTKDQPKKPSGKVVTRFTIGTDGKVSKAEIVSSELKNEKLEACVVEALKTVTFPAGGATQVEYPFQFAPKVAPAKKKPRA